MLTFLKNVHVFSPIDLGVRHVLVAGGKIVYLGPDEPAIDALPGAEKIDFEGARLIPGFIDPHAHVTGGGGEAGYETAVPAPLVTEYTRAGVTTVVGLLGTDDLVRTTSALIARLKALRAEGLSAFGYTGGYHFPMTTLTGSVRSDIVHVEELIGAGEVAISDHRSSQPSLGDILRLASEVHVAGLMTRKAGLVHFHVGDGKRGLELIRRAIGESELPPRVFYPTHVNRRKTLFEEACELALAGCPVDITAFPVADGEDAYCAEDALERFLDGGFPKDLVTISSDGGGCLPVFDERGEVIDLDYAREQSIPMTLKELLNRGRLLESVLPAFTTNAANILRLASKGQIATGFDADLVVLDEYNLPSWTMARGQWHVRDGKTVIQATFG